MNKNIAKLKKSEITNKFYRRIVMKKHIIALSGDLASGKGTVSKILMEELNFGIYRFKYN